MVEKSITHSRKARIDGVELAYELHGGGDPVLLIHGSIIGDAYAPLLAQAALTGRYRLVSFHRRGFGGSGRATAPVSIARQAADATALLAALGIERAHVVGHSYGGLIALQMALDAPERVHSLALLEPGILWCANPEESMAVLRPLIEMYRAGDVGGAIDAFVAAVGGPTARDAIDAALPGWFEQAVADAPTFFEVELPAMMDWRFTPEMAAQMAQPVLSVLGADSAPIDPWVVEEHELLQAWMPQTEAFVLPNATHALQIMNPAGMAEGLAAFFGRHAVGVTA